MKNTLIACAAGLVLIASGCTTGSKVIHNDPTQHIVDSDKFVAADLREIASKMVGSMLAFPPLVQATTDRRPIIYVEKIKNKTSQHIDTESITDTISTKLIQSGKFRFVDMTKVDAVLEQIDFQQSGVVDPNTAVQFGKQIGAELMLYGNASDIVTQVSNRERNTYYKFTLKLLNLETGIVEWIDEKEIDKTRTRNTFGG